MEKFTELFTDVGLLWSNYSSAYISGIRNTLILAVIATLIQCSTVSSVWFVVY